MPYTHAADVWIVVCVFTLAGLAGLVTWAFTTLGKPPAGSEAMYAAMWGALGDTPALCDPPPEWFRNTYVEGMERAEADVKAFVAEQNAELHPKLERLLGGGEWLPDSAANDAEPNIVTIEMELAEAEEEFPLPEDRPRAPGRNVYPGLEMG